MDQRGQLLRAAVGFAACSMPSYDRAPWALRTWLDSWPGVGRQCHWYRMGAHAVHATRRAAWEALDRASR